MPLSSSTITVAVPRASGSVALPMPVTGCTVEVDSVLPSNHAGSLKMARFAPVSGSRWLC
jgi:hypothetical protein